MSDSRLLREVFRGENGLRSRVPKEDVRKDGYPVKRARLEPASANVSKQSREPHSTSSSEKAEGKRHSKPRRTGSDCQSDMEGAVQEQTKQQDNSKGGAQAGKREGRGTDGPQSSHKADADGSSHDDGRQAATAGHFNLHPIHGSLLDWAEAAMLDATQKAGRAGPSGDGRLWPKCFYQGVPYGFLASPEEASSRKRLAARVGETFAHEGVSGLDADKLLFSLVTTQGERHDFPSGHDAEWEKVVITASRIYIQPAPPPHGR